MRGCEGFEVSIAPAGSRSKYEAPKLMFGRLIYIICDSTPIWQSLWREDGNISNLDKFGSSKKV